MGLVAAFKLRAGGAGAFEPLALIVSTKTPNQGPFSVSPPPQHLAWFTDKTNLL